MAIGYLAAGRRKRRLRGARRGYRNGMGYVIAVIVVLLVVAAAVTFFVLTATRDRPRGRGRTGDGGSRPLHEDAGDGRAASAGADGARAPGEAGGEGRRVPDSERLANRE